MYFVLRRAKRVSINFIRIIINKKIRKIKFNTISKQDLMRMLKTCFCKKRQD